MTEQIQPPKPCPFCGTPDPTFTMGHKHSTHAYMECEYCYARGPDVDSVGQSSQRARDMAVVLWNNRESSKLTQLLEQERDDSDSMLREIKRLRDMMTLALCMLDREPAEILRRHAEMIGINL